MADANRNNAQTRGMSKVVFPLLSMVLKSQMMAIPAKINCRMIFDTCVEDVRRFSLR